MKTSAAASVVRGRVKKGRISGKSGKCVCEGVHVGGGTSERGRRKFERDFVVTQSRSEELKFACQTNSIYHTVPNCAFIQSIFDDCIINPSDVTQKRKSLHFALATVRP